MYLSVIASFPASRASVACRIRHRTEIDLKVVFLVERDMNIKPTAQVTLVTSKGDIQIQLFAKELPHLCREFIRNCINKNYVGLKFAMVTSSLIQTLCLESPTEIKHEKNSRIKFNARGAIGLLRIENKSLSSANGFFISLDPPSEYSHEYVFIGNVVGESIYNVLKIKDVELKPGTQEPLYPVTIEDCIVSEPFFDGLEKRAPVEDGNKETKKQKIPIKLDYEEDEFEEDSTFVVRSAHELLSSKLTSKNKAISANPRTELIVTEIPAKDSPESTPDNKSTAEPAKDSCAEVRNPTALNEYAVGAGTDALETEQSSVSGSTSHKKESTTRDPTIDPYDPYLDFSEDEVSYEALCKHKFICRS